MSNFRPFLLIFALSCASLAFADSIVLKNGDKLTGKITRSDEKSITLKTEFAGEVKIDRAGITTVTADTPVNVQLKDKTVVGTVETAGENVRIQTQDAGAFTAPIADVVALRDDASQKAYLRQLERTQHPKLNDFWVGFVSLNVAGAAGNSQTSTWSTAARASRTAGKNSMALYFTQVYATQSTTEPHGATANRISGGYRIDRDVNHRLYVFGTADFDYDKFLDLDLRSVLGGGLGIHVWKSRKGFLDLGAGGVWNREKFGDGLLRNSGEVLMNQEFGYTVLNRLKLSERIALYPNLTETGEYRLNFDLGASMPIFKALEWNIGFSNRYLSNPPTGLKSNDLLYTTGIRYSFDQTKR